MGFVLVKYYPYEEPKDAVRVVCGGLAATLFITALEYNPHHPPAVPHPDHIEIENSSTMPTVGSTVGFNGH